MKPPPDSFEVFAAITAAIDLGARLEITDEGCWLTDSRRCLPVSRRMARIVLADRAKRGDGTGIAN